MEVAVPKEQKKTFLPNISNCIFNSSSVAMTREGKTDEFKGKRREMRGSREARERKNPMKGWPPAPPPTRYYHHDNEPSKGSQISVLI